MISMETNRLVDDYLRRLEEAAAHLQRARRTELVAEIREHIDAALGVEDEADEVAVRNVLERLGPPEEIVEAAEPAPRDGSRQMGATEIAALLVLFFASFAPVIGFAAGAALVITSGAWTRRDKLIGLLIGLPAALLFLIFAGYGGLGAVELFVLVFGVAGLPSALYLGFRLLRR